MAEHDAAAKETVRAWAEAVRAGDRAAFDRIARQFQGELFGYLFGRQGCTWDEALDLTQQTMYVALRRLAEGGRPVEQPRAWLFGIARNLMREQRRRSEREIPVEEADLAPVADDAALRAFAEADRELDRQLAVAQNMPTFLDLMAAAVESMPAKGREVLRQQWLLAEQEEFEAGVPSRVVIDALVERLGISRAEASRRIYEAPEMLREVAAALFVAATARADCPGLSRHLDAAGWQVGRPFSDGLRRQVRHHLRACRTCQPALQRAVQRIAALPAVVLVAVLGLEEQRHALVDTAFAGQSDPPADGGGGDGDRAEVPRPDVRVTESAAGDADRSQPAGTAVAGLAGLTPPLQPTSQSEPSRRRRRAALVLVVLCLLGGAAVVGWQVFGAAPPPTARAQALEPAHPATPTAGRGQGRPPEAVTTAAAPKPAAHQPAGGRPAPLDPRRPLARRAGTSPAPPAGTPQQTPALDQGPIDSMPLITPPDTLTVQYAQATPATCGLDIYATADGPNGVDSVVVDYQIEQGPDWTVALAQMDAVHWTGTIPLGTDSGGTHSPVTVTWSVTASGDGQTAGTDPTTTVADACFSDYTATLN